MKDYYFTIDKPGVAEYKDKGSTFLAYAYPLSDVQEFKNILAELKKEHPKANHHCFAYKIGLSGNVYRVSDDGEPSGTAGRPILGQIESRNLTDVLIIVVRYFGGTLLGVPGLIKAYKTVASLVLQTVPAVQKQRMETLEISFNYENMNDVMKLLKEVNSNILHQDLTLFPHIKAQIPSIRMDELKFKLKNLHNVEFKNLV